MVFLNLLASSAKKTICPVAAPGEAGNPCAITLACLSALGSKTGCNNSSNLFGSNFNRASFSVRIPSFNKSTAILTIAAPVRLPLRVCSIHSLPS